MNTEEFTKQLLDSLPAPVDGKWHLDADKLHEVILLAYRLGGKDAVNAMKEAFQKLEFKRTPT